MLLLIATCSISQTLFGQEDDSIPFLTYEELEPWWVVEKAVAPVYPHRMLSRSKTGCVTIGYIIETNGKVSTVEPLSAFPNGAFATAARNAVRKWRFKPTQANTDPFPTYALQNIVFRLEGAGIKKAPPTEEINQICWDAAQRRIAERTGQAPSDLGATD